MKIQTPIVVRVDNVGAIFMSENVAISPRTKHVDIRYRFLREFVYDRFLRIIFVKSEDNVSDIMTKNTTGEIHKRHVKMLIEKKGGDDDMLQHGASR